MDFHDTIYSTYCFHPISYPLIQLKLRDMIIHDQTQTTGNISTSIYYSSLTFEKLDPSFVLHYELLLVAYC